MQIVSGRFFQILWPSQNIRTLKANGALNELNQESNVRFFDGKIEQNKEQKLAVTSIVK